MSRRWHQTNSRSDAFRQILSERDDGLCWWCSKPLDWRDAHLDHVIPLSFGGASIPSNLQLLHPRCNVLKGRRLIAIGPERRGQLDATRHLPDPRFQNYSEEEAS